MRVARLSKLDGLTSGSQLRVFVVEVPRELVGAARLVVPEVLWVGLALVGGEACRRVRLVRVLEDIVDKVGLGEEHV